ncbi:uncharacterized protein LOC121955282 [Plectropomus leopardus]|uniref:uncharacterized protein LOC121955282 n=1 Tax=Plectropomus leopardus TaxID=160734 RepID=UPI001C4BA742|nr:uncharacterized protein LOC121955282 [Plectropomus leopardus]
MMAEFRWIKTSLLLILVFQFTASVGLLSGSLAVRNGDDVTLPCENVIDDQTDCDSTLWVYSKSRNTLTIELFKLGQIGKNVKSDRLSVTENCSLVIKKVTREDAGHYGCIQIKSGRQQGQDALVDLSVINMSYHEDTDEVTLKCSVATYERCTHTVKWLFEGKEVDEDNKGINTSQSPCSASVAFQTSLSIYTSRYKLFTCKVTGDDKVQEFSFRSQSSGQKPAFTCQSALDYIMLVMRVAELLLITVITVLLFRAPWNQSPPDDNTVKNDESVANYENVEEPSVSVRLH